MKYLVYRWRIQWTVHLVIWMVYVGFPVPRRWWCSRTRDGGRIITSQYTGPCPFGPKIASEADQPRDLAGLAWTCPKCQTFCSLTKLMCFWAFLGDFPDFLFHLPSEQVSAGWSVRCAGYCITAPATCLQPRPHPPRSSQLHQIQIQNQLSSAISPHPPSRFHQPTFQFRRGPIKLVNHPPRSSQFHQPTIQVHQDRPQTQY